MTRHGRRNEIVEASEPGGMIFTVPAGKVLGGLFVALALLVVVLVTIHFWQWVLAIVGLAFLCAGPSIYRDHQETKRIYSAK